MQRPSTFLLILFLIPTTIYADSPAIPVKPGEADYQKAMIAVQNGDLRDAEEHLREAVLAEPNNPQYHFELANLYAVYHDDYKNQGDDAGAQYKMQQAAAELEQAVMIHPDFLPAHFNLGVVYKNLQRYENAREQFKEVLRLDPSQQGAMLQIGQTYEAQGFYDDAEAVYQELKEKFPDDPRIQEALFQLEQARYEERMGELSRRQSRMNMLSSSFSQLGPNGYNDPYGSQDYGAQQSGQNSMMQQGIAYLGSMALQQLLKNKNSTVDSQ